LGNTLLITFGCSWTYGVGVNYEFGMSQKELEQLAWDENICNSLSWRGILSKTHSLDNLNFSVGGSSNQLQFRRAEEFFSSSKFKNLKKSHNRIIVVWGITSTSRNELFDNDAGIPVNFLYHQYKKPIAKLLLVDHYNHEWEVFRLRRQMLHWEQYLGFLGVELHWFDTFNTHNYHKNDLEFKKTHPNEQKYQTVAGPDWPSYDNFCAGDFLKTPDHILEEIYDIYPDTETPKCMIDINLNPRDLMSWLAIKNGMTNIDSDYHTSSWSNDSNRVKYLVNKNLLNPLTYHPTAHTHQILADFFSLKLNLL